MNLLDIIEQRYVNKPTILKLTLLSICCMLITVYFRSSPIDVITILMIVLSTILCLVDFVLVVLFVIPSEERNMIHSQHDSV
jgi:hypothetical protein